MMTSITLTLFLLTFIGNGRDDFHYFILDEMARRCDSRKRPSGADGRMDSPNRKRSRQCCNETEDLC